MSLRSSNGVGQHLLGQPHARAHEGEPVQPPGLRHAAGALLQPARCQLARLDLLAEPGRRHEDDAVDDVRMLDGGQPGRGGAAGVTRHDHGRPVVHRPFPDVADHLAEDLSAEGEDLVDRHPLARVFDGRRHDVGGAHQPFA